MFLFCLSPEVVFLTSDGDLGFAGFVVLLGVDLCSENLLGALAVDGNLKVEMEVFVAEEKVLSMTDVVSLGSKSSREIFVLRGGYYSGYFGEVEKDSDLVLDYLLILKLFTALLGIDSDVISPPIAEVVSIIVDAYLVFDIMLQPGIHSADVFRTDGYVLFVIWPQRDVNEWEIFVNGEIQHGFVRHDLGILSQILSQIEVPTDLLLDWQLNVLLLLWILRVSKLKMGVTGSVLCDTLIVDQDQMFVEYVEVFPRSGIWLAPVTVSWLINIIGFDSKLLVKGKLGLEKSVQRLKHRSLLLLVLIALPQADFLDDVDESTAAPSLSVDLRTFSADMFPWFSREYPKDCQKDGALLRNQSPSCLVAVAFMLANVSLGFQNKTHQMFVKTPVCIDFKSIFPVGFFLQDELPICKWVCWPLEMFELYYCLLDLFEDSYFCGLIFSSWRVSFENSFSVGTMAIRNMQCQQSSCWLENDKSSTMVCAFGLSSVYSNTAVRGLWNLEEMDAVKDKELGSLPLHVLKLERLVVDLYGVICDQGNEILLVFIGKSQQGSSMDTTRTQLWVGIVLLTVMVLRDIIGFMRTAELRLHRLLGSDCGKPYGFDDRLSLLLSCFWDLNGLSRVEICRKHSEIKLKPGLSLLGHKLSG